MKLPELIIKETRETPGIQFIPAEGIFKIYGNSFPANAEDFYRKVLDWLENFKKVISTENVDRLEVVVNLNYFNTSSAKYLYEIMSEMETIYLLGIDMIVKWHYEKDDMDMIEAGKDLADNTAIPFEFIQKN